MLYKDSHPITYKVASSVFKGDNFDRYLMGRQFMVLLDVFVIHQCFAPVDTSVTVFGLPSIVIFIFLDIGLLMVFITNILGQVNTEINASYCMIDYLNTYFALFTVYAALALEWLGIVHAAYLIKNVMSAISGKPILSNEPPKTGFTFAFFWGRVLMSVAITAFCTAIVVVSLFT
jgi:hypothetical protein